MSLIASGNTDPGRLDRRVSLHSPFVGRDAAGGSVVEWFEAGTVWAGKQPLRGGRLYAAEAKHFEATLVYRIRHRDDVRAGWRLAHGDDVFEIIDVQELGRQHLLDLALRGLDQTPGSVASVLLLEGTGAADALLVEDGSLFLLETAA